MTSFILRAGAGLLGAAALGAASSSANAAPVLMISVDGLRPADVLEAPERGMQLPVLQDLVRRGAYASGVNNALPSVTYPNHTTLITGVWPARHGVASNLVFDPLLKNNGGWYWYASDIKVRTLWDAAHVAGQSVASLGWPVTVGAKSIDYNIPEYWRAHDHEDAKLERALATPGLPETLEREGGVALVDTGDTSEAADALKAEDAAALYKLKAPVFFTLHLSSLDDVEHEFGPGSPQAKTALMRLDAEIGQIIAAARTVEPGLVVAVVSDHGFGPVEHDINLGAAFVQAGLISLGPDGQPASWEASPWNSGGSSAVVLARPGDAVLRRRVETLLTALAADPASGVARIASRADIAHMGGGGGIDFFVDAKIGYTFGSRYSGPLVTPGSEKGSHGYFPDRPEMHATLILEGPGVPKKALGAVDMRDVAPTLAKILGVALPDADGTPLL